MVFSSAILLSDKWSLFVKYGATQSCTYSDMLDSTYSGGNVTKTAKTVYTDIDIVFDSLGGGSVQKYQEQLEDGSTIRTIDRVAIFPTLKLPVVPKINDLIVDPSLAKWIVKAIAEDPVNAHYELLVRPTI
jgi:hypothetical protein